MRDLASIDFFVVPTATFRVLFGFLVLAHDRRRVLHFNVTAHPTAGWTAQQLVEGFPLDTAPRYLIRDRDSIFGQEVRGRIRGMGIEEVVIAPRNPLAIAIRRAADRQHPPRLAAASSSA